MHSPAIVTAFLLCAAAAPATAGGPAAGETAFGAACRSCHAVTADAPPKWGPSLFGIVGRAAGVLPGYAYSPAMKAFARPWTPAALDQYLANPKALVPGTKMPFAGMADAAERSAIIAYLKARK